jgi:hypothetical protein
MTKYFIALIAFAGIFVAAEGQVRQLPDEIKLPPHPRILLLKDDEGSIRTAIATDPIWKKMHETISRHCDMVIDSATLERVLFGDHLLNTSRYAVRRIFFLSYVYRITHDDKYAERARRELIAVCKFDDWNPSHFLDVAEMTTAVSIGYDWLYEKLSPDERRLIEEAIVKKGLEPSFDKQYNWFLEASNNWNQVCNAGMTYGALAVWDKHEQLSRKIINRALSTIHLPMDQYKPVGGYPEGYGYWNYGTSYNVMFLSAIEKVFHEDFGLSTLPGFMNTPAFIENMTGNSGRCFNWADCRLTGTLKPTMFWFAQRNNDPSILWMEKKYLMEADYSRFTAERLLPNVMIWGTRSSINKVTAPKKNFWVGQGASPVASMRTSWNEDGIYLGFKAGSPSTPHGHMDVGSFVMESDGIRWASDLGMQNYETLESKGMDIWGKTQDATRWTIFRINSYSHNILTVDSLQQRVTGHASIDKFSDKPEFSYAISDLTSVYEGQLAAVKRGVGIKDGKYVVVRDEYTALGKPVTIRWAMLTSADVRITGKNTAELVKDGKTLTLKVVSEKEIKMKTWSTAPTNDFDAENPGTVMVGFEVKVTAGEKVNHTVVMGGDKVKYSVKELAEW